MLRIFLLSTQTLYNRVDEYLELPTRVELLNSRFSVLQEMVRGFCCNTVAERAISACFACSNMRILRTCHTVHLNLSY